MSIRQNRFKKADFNNLFKKGKTIGRELIFLRFRKNNLKQSRFCWVVSLKISKKATTRNKIKRQLREIVKANLKNIKSGFDIAIIAKPEIINKNYQEIKNVLENLIKRTKIYR